MIGAENLIADQVSSQVLIFVGASLFFGPFLWEK
jgi:hypothetical protein